MNKALFLDRDGVINIDHGYVHRKEDVVFIEGIFSLTRAAKEKGYLVIVVTNQAGIGRGYYTENDFHTLMQWMQFEFQSRGARIDAVYHCPFHPAHGIGQYKRESIFRKPRPGMILKAAHDYEIDVAASILVGDSPKDIQAGTASGISNLFFFSKDNSPMPGAQTVADLSEIVAFL